MKIMVTGGAGFIGSHVVDAFITAGHDVVVVDDLSTGYRHNLNPQARFYELNIDSNDLEEVFKIEKPEILDHHAAQVSVPLSVKQPLKDVRTNVYGLVNLLDLAAKYQTRKFIYISSGGAMYGEATEYPTTEEYRPIPLSVYAINKMVGENYLYFYKHSKGLDYTVLRYANVYGPRQVSHGEAGVVSIFCEKLLDGEQPTINLYPDQKRGMIRDYVYVKDVVKANMLALEAGSGLAFNIGTCKETSTYDLYEELSAIIGVKVNPLEAPAREGDLRRSQLNYDKARQTLGWTPEYDLKKGLLETVEYFRTKALR